jgi:APA family basic amino acid/polyamine antiporter
MPSDIQSLFDKKINPQKFKRTIGLFGATTIGVGALMGAGIYVLIGEAAAEAGPSLILSYLLCGFLAYATTLLYAELARILPKSGGGYTYAYDVLGSIGGFATGWFLALGSLFASGIYAIGFAEYIVALLGLKFGVFGIKMVAVGITLLIVLPVLRPSKSKKKIDFQSWIVWGNVAILLLLIGFSVFYLKPDIATPVFPNGAGGTFGAISLIYISFFGYQLIANNADEIIEPQKTIPKAMKLSMLISIGLNLLVAIAAIFTIPWKELSESHAPLVLVANKVLAGKGWVIISVGGILASLGALSSTLISQSRQTYSMGKDRFFPDSLAELDSKTNQPKNALLIGVVLTVLILLFFDLNFIAKAANFSLIISLLPVSLALRKIYKNNPSVRPKKKWRRYLPHITLVINFGLLLSLGVVSLAFGQQLALVGAAIYFFYSRKKEIKGREGLNIVLESKKKFSFFSANKVVVTMANPETQRNLLMFSDTLLSKKGGEVVVLAIKDVPTNKDFYEALSEAGETLDIIKRSVELAKDKNILIKPIIRASRDVSKGIINAAEEEKSNLIIMGFPKQHREGDSGILYKIMKNSNTDVIALNIKTQSENFKPKRIGVYVHGEENLNLTLICATAVAEKFDSRVIINTYLPYDYTLKQKTKADKLMIESLEEFKSPALYDININKSRYPYADLLKQSANLDLLIVGVDGLKSDKKFTESLPFKIADNAECSVILVKSVSKIKKIVSSL